MTIKIPFLDDLKEILAYTKAIKEAYIKPPGRKKKDPQTIHVMGHSFDFMLNKSIATKYYNLGSLVVIVHINGVQVQNALIDLDAFINVMTREVLLHLNIISIRENPTILQLSNSSIVKFDGMIEDVIVTLDSWEYTVHYVILSPKETLGGYPIILG